VEEHNLAVLFFILLTGGAHMRQSVLIHNPQGAQMSLLCSSILEKYCVTLLFWMGCYIIEGYFVDSQA
jgi:hypothetical protein